MVRAASSLPVPLSPVIRTEAVLGAASSMRWKTSCILREDADQCAELSGVAQEAARGFQLTFSGALAGGVL